MHVFVRSFLFSFLLILAVFLSATSICLCDDSSESKQKKDLAEIRARAEAGYIQQQLELAADYLVGRGVSQDLVQSAHWYQKAAAGGDADAENQIGYFYERGIGVRIDMERAIHWYQLASASGSLQAKVNLGVHYLDGTGVPRNPSTARQLFLEAEQKGSGIAAAYLGDLYLLGLGVPQDVDEAEKWFESGVHLHDAVAAFDLAYLYSDQPGHRHDLARAAELFRRSAADGYVRGMHSLGLLLVNHPSLASSPEEGVTILQQSSLAGSWKSSVVLGLLARDGQAMPADPALASYCFHLAVLQGGEPVHSLLANDFLVLARRLSPQEEAVRAAQADAWFQQHRVPLMFVLNEKLAKSNFPLAAVAGFADTPQMGQ